MSGLWFEVFWWCQLQSKPDRVNKQRVEQIVLDVLVDLSDVLEVSQLDI
jgi:hypothetical protein